MSRLRWVLAGVPVGVLVAVLLVVVATGLWPPVYTVVSGSMAPNVEEADLVVVVDEDRATPTGSRAGVVTARVGHRTEYRRFGRYGDVVIFRPNGSERPTPVIHRARFWVERGENWYDEANPAFVRADDCAELRNCPAPHAGFVTKGDANAYYDQSVGISEPVRPDWIRGVAVLRVPDAGRPSLWLHRHSLAPTFPEAFGYTSASRCPSRIAPDRPTTENRARHSTASAHAGAVGRSIDVPAVA